MKNLKSKIINLITNYRLPITEYFSGFAGIRPHRLPITDYRLLILACCLLLTYNSFAFTNYVWSGGSETPPYDTWATAAKSIQPAVDYAVEGNVVIVTNGVYTLSSYIMLATNNIILKSVNGAENTVIDGNLSTRCIYLKGSSVIDGFLIRNADSSGNGAGIFVFNSGSILNCTFTNNVVSIGGGAIYAKRTIVSNCYFKGNEAENGGAVFMRLSSSVKDCVFVNNIALTNGGSIYFDGAGSGNVSDCIISSNRATSGGGVKGYGGGVVSNCTISGNSAILGGGAYCFSGGSVSDCTISGNTATTDGGGAYCNSGGVVSGCTISGNYANWWSGGGVFCKSGGAVSECTIIGNGAFGDGGGTYCDSGGTFSACTISGNSAGSYGGGAYFNSGGAFSACTISSNRTGTHGGGAYFNSGGSVSACTISSNSANYGGGVYCNFGGTLTNCLIYDMNSAKEGGGAYLFKGGEIYNSTFADNYVSDLGGGIVCDNGGIVVNSIVYDNQAGMSDYNWWCKHIAPIVDFSYCCTIPIAGLPGGNGCISNNPEFVTPGEDYRLQALSPCRDSGSNMAWMTFATDLDGNPRIIGGIVDMGCYEYIPEPGIILLTLSASLIVISALRRVR